MMSGAVIAYLNLASRWVLFSAVAYKAISTKEKGWILLSAAFFIGSFDTENYILTPLGIHILPDAYDIASKIPNFTMAVLFVWGALHLKHEKTSAFHVLMLSVFTVTAYLWLFLLATDAFKDNFALRSLYPSLAYGAALIYFGLVLWRHVVPRCRMEVLFPLGLISLGALNLTYPFTRDISWFAPIGFALGAIFRLSAALGALKFVLYPITPIRETRRGNVPRGALMYSPGRAPEDIFSHPGVILITRTSPARIKETLHPESMAFWITRVKEGRISETPMIYGIGPTKIDILTDLLTKAIERGYRIVYIDAFEYLMVENGFGTALKFLLTIKDRMVSVDGTIMVTIDEDALSPQQRRLLEKEFEKMPHERSNFSRKRL